MNERAAVRPGDEVPFIEGWFDLNRLKGDYDLKYIAVQSLCRLVELSRQAAGKIAHSHRGFNVGAAILAHDSQGHRTGIYFGGNYTPYSGAEWNCAEKRGFERVLERGFDEVLALAVCGPHQADPSGVETVTLHPCPKCRGMLEISPMTRPDNLVATSLPDGSAYELYTRDSLLNLHRSGQPQPFPATHPLLPFYWEQVKNHDAAEDRAEMEALDRIARLNSYQSS